MAKKDMFCNDVAGCEPDVPMGQSDKPFQGDNQASSKAQMKSGKQSSSGFSVEEDDMWSNIPQGHDRV